MFIFQALEVELKARCDWQIIYVRHTLRKGACVYQRGILCLLLAPLNLYPYLPGDRTSHVCEMSLIRLESIHRAWALLK